MPSSTPTLLAPRCASCCRHLLKLGLRVHPPKPSLIQVRGKSNNPKASPTINVRLLKDFVGYGPAGAIIPVPIGRMRNKYYPERIAEYVPYTELRALKMRNVRPQRDPTFGKEDETDANELAKGMERATIETPTRRPLRVDLDLLKPHEAFAAFEKVLPREINFYRTPIAEPSKDSSQISPLASLSVTSITQTSQQQEIYGSVSVADIANNLRATIEASEYAGRVTFDEENIEFTDQGAEKMERAKRLGSYVAQIKVKGQDGIIPLRVNVVPEDFEQQVQSAAAAAEVTAAEQIAEAVEEEEVLEKAAAASDGLADRQQASQEPMRSSNISP